MHYPEASQMCKYIETIGDLCERGGDWQTYDLLADLRCTYYTDVGHSNFWLKAACATMCPY